MFSYPYSHLILNTLAASVSAFVLLDVTLKSAEPQRRWLILGLLLFALLNAWVSGAAYMQLVGCK